MKFSLNIKVWNVCIDIRVKNYVINGLYISVFNWLNISLIIYCDVLC